MTYPVYITIIIIIIKFKITLHLQNKKDGRVKC